MNLGSPLLLRMAHIRRQAHTVAEKNGFQRMTPKDFAAYRKLLGVKKSTVATPPTTGRTIRVSGYGEDATAAINACNGDNTDHLEVPWAPSDYIVREVSGTRTGISDDLSLW